MSCGSKGTFSTSCTAKARPTSSGRCAERRPAPRWRGHNGPCHSRCGGQPRSKAASGRNTISGTTSGAVRSGPHVPNPAGTSGSAMSQIRKRSVSASIRTGSATGAPARRADVEQRPRIGLAADRPVAGDDRRRIALDQQRPRLPGERLRGSGARVIRESHRGGASAAARRTALSAAKTSEAKAPA